MCQRPLEHVLVLVLMNRDLIFNKSDLLSTDLSTSQLQYSKHSHLLANSPPLCGLPLPAARLAAAGLELHPASACKGALLASSSLPFVIRATERFMVRPAPV